MKFVSEDRADFTFTESAIVDIFNNNSDNKLVKANKEPIEIFENTFLFKRNDDSLKKIFNKEIKSMKLDNTIKRLIEKYSPGKDLFILD